MILAVAAIVLGGPAAPGVPASGSDSAVPITGAATADAMAVRQVGTTTPAASPQGRIRAAFYYPWFPETWGQQPASPFTNYVPSAGSYSSDDLATVRSQIAEMQYGGITLGIASWFGQGTITDRHWRSLIDAAAGTGFAWAPYFEAEGVSNPTAEQLADDLHYLLTTYSGRGSALAAIAGAGMLVFVYNADDTTTAAGCATVTRWRQAQELLASTYGESVFVDLKVFPGYTSCADDPSIGAWHQYGPSSASHDFSRAPGGGAFSISPGFWKSGTAYGAAPFLARDAARWASDVAAMNASPARWQLVTTFDEWGEGTAIESSSGCRVAVPAGVLCAWNGGAHSDYLEALHAAPVP